MATWYWGNILIEPPRPFPRPVNAAFARVLTDDVVGPQIHTAHVDVNGAAFVVAVPRRSESREADEGAMRDAAEAAWRGVPVADLPAARDAAYAEARRRYAAESRVSRGGNEAAGKAA